MFGIHVISVQTWLRNSPRRSCYYSFELNYAWWYLEAFSCKKLVCFISSDKEKLQVKSILKMNFSRRPKAFLKSHYELMHIKNITTIRQKKQGRYQMVAIFFSVNTFWLAYSGNKLINLTICQHYYFVYILMSPSSTVCLFAW